MHGINQTHGKPFVRTITVPTTANLTANRHRLDGETMFLQINPTSGTVRIYFSLEAFQRVIASGIGATDEYLELGATDFFEGPAQVSELFAVGIGGTATFQVVGYRKIA